MKQILIIGGSDAGVSAALRAREVYPIVGITIAVPDRFPNCSIGGLPFYFSGEASEWATLARRSAEEIEKMGIRLLLEHRVSRIDLEARKVEFIDKSGRTRMLPYDRLILAPGAASARPEAEVPGVFFLRCMDDALAMKRYIAGHHPSSAIIIGSDVTAMEMAEVLTRGGLSVTMLVRTGKVLETVDQHVEEIIRAELARNGVKLIDRIEVTSIEKQDGSLVVRNEQDVPLRGELVLVATGSRPDTAFAKAAGIPTGIQGAIRVNRAMATGVEDIYAAGDCVETWHRLLKRNVYLPLGTTAHKQGRVAGENAAGGCAEFVGTLGTQAVKIFDMVIARTGLKETEARESGFDPITAEIEVQDHAHRYPGAGPLRIRITGDRRTRKLLGAQIIGHYRAEVSKRIDVLAATISAELGVGALIDLDLSYSSPLNGAWDPVQAAALEWTRGLLTSRTPLPRPDLKMRDEAVIAASGRLSFAV